MSKLLCLLVLAHALLGCGEDPVEGETEPIAEPSGALDASALPRIKVTNAGEPCAGDQGCFGDLSQCLEESAAGTTYPGGYCTADCERSEECGPGAACPIGEAEAAEPKYAFTSTWARKCFKVCIPGSNDGCRPGYECESLADAYRAIDAPEPMRQTVCIPHGRSLGLDAGSPWRGVDLRRDAGPSAHGGGGEPGRDAGAGSGLDARGIDAGPAQETFRTLRE
jgi:hypothetical protein